MRETPANLNSQDAFISRIHVQLFYKDFTDEERQKVWMTFVTKLTKERGKYIRITMDAKDYIRGAEIRAVKWNGREIRNGEIFLNQASLDVDNLF